MTRHALVPLSEKSGGFLVCGGLHPQTERSQGCQIIYPSGQSRQIHSLVWPRRLDHTITLGEGDQAYVVGGRDGRLSETSVTDRGKVLYDGLILQLEPEGNITSSRMALPPTSWYGHTASWVPSIKEILFLGGVQGNGTLQMLDRVHLYNPQTDIWRKERTVWPENIPGPYGLYGHTATFVGDSIVVVGGSTEPPGPPKNQSTLSFPSSSSSPPSILILNITTLTWSSPDPQAKTSQTSEWVPSPRVGHTTTLLWDQRTLLVTWGKHLDRKEIGDKHPYLLDTGSWTFVKDMPRIEMGSEAGFTTSRSWRVPFLIGSVIVLVLLVSIITCLCFWNRLKRVLFLGKAQKEGNSFLRIG
ncbi:hypothetical protein BJ684DRAFT_21026 [Piptocephalis cylindrospora]|uniref:Galactose oxidase n=1 Tax=Piptocephalis cylindrospora TaxID=1907219 RepID=A0A4P9Y110_9FUNG|nr:hypothetical protein BJ684DRAFT_21026 [Piptocephalis cylindrospora]|eukprot:RKP12435.1 hypothetical protein BJ684DRAFT_21026 [Piptocephalis cylindrospora]